MQTSNKFHLFRTGSTVKTTQTNRGNAVSRQSYQIDLNTARNDTALRSLHQGNNFILKYLHTSLGAILWFLSFLRHFLSFCQSCKFIEFYFFFQLLSFLHYFWFFQDKFFFQTFCDNFFYRHVLSVIFFVTFFLIFFRQISSFTYLSVEISLPNYLVTSTQFDSSKFIQNFLVFEISSTDHVSFFLLRSQTMTKSPSNGSVKR